MVRRQVLSVAGAVLVTAFGGAGCVQQDQSSIDPSHRTFAGLDQAVVQEVISSQAAKERVAGDEQEVAAARYQGMVRNFIACRSALSAYRAWVASGVAPELAEQPVPTYPAPNAVDMDNDITAFQRDLASGDITLLRQRLTSESGCGYWVPAEPGDATGPTIADEVNGKR